MEQAQLELQLKVWKELAISKQILMRSATDALKLDPNCSQDELKVALDAVIKKIAEADSSVGRRPPGSQAWRSPRWRRSCRSPRRPAPWPINSAEEIRVAQESASRQIEIERANFTKEMQQMKSVVAEKDKTVKAINAALADTPENVVKKLKALRKEKQDEADGRRQAETTMGTLRKEKQQTDEQLTKANEKNAKLVTAYTDTHALGEQAARAAQAAADGREGSAGAARARQVPDRRSQGRAQGQERQEVSLRRRVIRSNGACKQQQRRAAAGVETQPRIVR